MQKHSDLNIQRLRYSKSVESVLVSKRTRVKRVLLCENSKEEDKTKHPDFWMFCFGGLGGNRTRAVEVLQTPAFPLRHQATTNENIAEDRNRINN